MSLDIFMVPYLNGEQAPFSRSLLHEIFGSDANMGDGPISSIRYPGLDGAQVYGAEDEIVDNLSFDHFGGERFMDGLLRLAMQTNSIIFWPSDGPVAAVTKAETLEHVDPELLAGFSEVKIVNSAKELEDYIAQS